MSMRWLSPFLVIGLAASVLGAAPALAQGASGAQAFFLDPSVRASGMGRASTAVFWGDDPNHWANPALLGYHHGIRYDWSRTQLVPDVAHDVFFTTKRLSVGAWGIGLSLAGKPWESLGGLRLDYGEEAITDPGSPDPVGTFRSFEDVNSFGIGVSLAEMTDNVLGLTRGKAASFRRFGDASFGWCTKTDSVSLAPAYPFHTSPGAGRVSTKDHGFLLRATPYNSLDYPGLIPSLDRTIRPVAGGLRFDVSYGEGAQNSDEATLTLLGGGQPDSIFRSDRRGWAVRTGVGFPGAIEDVLRDRGLGWLARSLTPLVSWGRAWDRIRNYSPRSSEAEIQHSGWELTLCNLYTIRRGRVDDPSGGIHGDTDGWGLGFRLGDVAGFRYDRATVPQAVGLERVKRKSFTFYADGLAVWRTLKARDPKLVSGHY